VSVTSPETMVEAVMADLLTYCAANSFTPKSNRPYAEPTVILPDWCPMLAVWCEQTLYRIAATGPETTFYDRTHALYVGWYVVNPKGAEVGGVGDPLTVQALGTTLEKLIVQLDTYSTGIPTIGAQLISTLRTRSLKPLAGAAWAGVIELDVLEST
jgi:hypothetical protein